MPMFWAPDAVPRMTLRSPTGGDHRGGEADRVQEGLTHHPAAGSDDHQQKGPVQLRKEAPPLLVGVLSA